MSQRILCVACGKRVEPGDYCSRCGTGLDEETQERINRERSAESEQRRLIGVCEELQEHAAGSKEHNALARIQARIEEKPIEHFMDE